MRRVHHLRSSSPASPDSQPRVLKPPHSPNSFNGSLVAFLSEQRRDFDQLDDADENENGNDTDDAQPITPSRATTDNALRVTGTKRSRYLRESDRRAIIGRIDKGEKQSALAKEFGVTRAAICHINKNRIEILTRSARSDVHAAARHPKRGMYTTSRSNFYNHDDDDNLLTMPQQQHSAVVNGRSALPMVYEVRSLALAINLTTLRASETSGRQFRAAADRAFRVLLEEALAAVPTRHVEVVASNGTTTSGLVADRPACAVFMSECGYPMLEAFRAIQPDSPTGFMTLDHDRDVQSGSPHRRVTLRKMCAPADLRSHNIFLLDATCATALEASVAIQSLVDFGAQESSIYFVTLVISAAAVADICEKFPSVHIVAVAVDPEVTSDWEVAPGVGNFQERYFNTTTIRQSDLGSNVDL